MRIKYLSEKNILKTELYNFIQVLKHLSLLKLQNEYTWMSQ